MDCRVVDWRVVMGFMSGVDCMVVVGFMSGL